MGSVGDRIFLIAATFRSRESSRRLRNRMISALTMAIGVTVDVWILIIEILPQSLTIYGKPRFTAVSRIALPRIATICYDYAHVCGWGLV
jgi:hypothetical protein